MPTPEPPSGASAASDGAQALSVQTGCASVQVDSLGNLYFPSTNNYIWKLPAGSDRLLNLVGTGQYGNSGDGGPGTSASVFQPSDLTLDFSGGLYFASGSLLRRLDLKSGVVNAVQPKNGGTPYVFGGPLLNHFLGLATMPSGDLLVKDGYANRVWRYRASDSSLIPIAGNGQHVYIPDVVTDWSTVPSVISDVAIHPDGSLLIAADSRIYQGNLQTGVLKRIAGTGLRGYSGDGGPALQATFGQTLRLYPNAAGDLYVGDSETGYIRRIDSHTGVVTSVASGVEGFFVFGDTAAYCGPVADSPGNVYYTTFTDIDQILRVDRSTGKTTVYVGGATLLNGADGTLAKDATLLGDLCPWLIDPSDNLYFSHGGYLRWVDAQTGLLHTVGALAPTGLSRTASGDFYFTSTH